MKKIVRRICILTAATCALAVLGAQNARASEKFDGFSFISGEEIYKLCRSGEASDQHACAMYVCGMIDGWQMEYIVTGKKPYQFCLRAGTTCSELGALVPKFLDDNPKIRASAAGGVVATALVRTFPCSPALPPLPGTP